MTRLGLISAAALFCLTAIGLVHHTAQADEGEWGNLSGRFVLEGEIPKAKRLLITLDRKHFADEELFDESLVVNPMNRGLANVVVYAISGRSDLMPVHPSYEGLKKEPVEVEMKAGRFSPRIILLQTGQTLRIANKDRVAHNAKITLLRNPPFGVISPPNATLKFRYDQEERLPGSVSCTIHPWMKGNLLVRSNPYMTKTDANGRFEIKNLPVGKHRFQFWHEKMGYVRNIELGKAKTDPKGRLEVTITAGDNHLMAGKINVADLK